MSTLEYLTINLVPRYIHYINEPGPELGFFMIVDRLTDFLLVFQYILLTEIYLMFQEVSNKKILLLSGYTVVVLNTVFIIRLAKL